MITIVLKNIYTYIVQPLFLFIRDLFIILGFISETFSELPVWWLMQIVAWCVKKKNLLFFFLHIKLQNSEKMKTFCYFFILSYPLYIYFYFVLLQQHGDVLLQAQEYILLPLAVIYWPYFIIAKFFLTSENLAKPHRVVSYVDLQIFFIFITLAPINVFGLIEYYGLWQHLIRWLRG